MVKRVRRVTAFLTLTCSLSTAEMRRMAGRFRVEYAGATYDLLNTGDRHEPVCNDDHDRQCFLETPAGACVRIQRDAERNPV